MRDDDILSLAGDFGAATHNDWLAEVAGALKGAAFETLRSVTLDGIDIEPLYVREHVGEVAQVPGLGTSRRASNPDGSAGGWDVRQQHRFSSTEAALNQAVLTDLERGVTSVELVGVDEADLGAVLAGVHLELAPVALTGAGDGVGLARRYLELANARDVAAEALVADLGCDPIGRLAQVGTAGVPIGQAIQTVSTLAAEVGLSHPGTRTIRVDGLVFADAGASPATELAAIVGCGVEYLRELAGAGLDSSQALSQILLRTSVGTDQFGDIAKLRALRVLWSRVSEVLGVQGHRSTVQAATSPLSATESDPWSNIMRTTVGCFSAAVGGADIVTTIPFDAVLGVPDALGLRLARNTQLALIEESNLHRVIDPGGGSWYLETLTDQLADAAWLAFQQLEAEGGVVASLQSGALQARIRDQAARLDELASTGQHVIIGVNQFANLDDSVPTRAPYPSKAKPSGDTEIEPLVARGAT